MPEVGPSGRGACIPCLFSYWEGEGLWGPPILLQANTGRGLPGAQDHKLRWALGA